MRCWRAATLLGGALGCLLLGGCIYLRLLEVKNQLADFDRYFETDLRDGLKLTCRTPVLLDEDMAFFHLAPESRQRVGVAERWHFRWVKDGTAPAGQSGSDEIAMDLIFVNHRLTRVRLPERLFAFVPKHFFLTVVRAFGQAQIDREHRTARASVHEVLGPDKIPPPPTGQELQAQLGAPIETQETPAGLIWRYAYKPASADQHAGRIEATFTLDPVTHNLRRIQARIIELTFDVVLVGSTPPSPADMKPADHGAAQ
ncbi:MAG: hypothetical protein WC485_09005 [Opitutaceae bacterium]